MKKPENVTELLHCIKNAPGMYIGQKSVFRLKHFMDGYCCAVQYAEINYGLNVYYSFIEWLREKYRVVSVVSYDTFLIDAFPDDKQAFDAFFDEFELFLHEREQ